MRIRFIKGRNGNLVVLGRRRDPSGRPRAHATIVNVADKPRPERLGALWEAMDVFSRQPRNAPVTASEDKEA